MVVRDHCYQPIFTEPCDTRELSRERAALGCLCRQLPQGVASFLPRDWCYVTAIRKHFCRASWSTIIVR